MQETPDVPANSVGQTSEAVVEGSIGHRNLKWTAGFWMAAAATPAAVVATIGYAIGALGILGALAVWTGTALIAMLQNKIFAELAGMFPDKSGGLARYAHEGWRRYFTPFGAVSAFGYWAGWSLSLAAFGVTIGSLIQAQWFPTVTWTISIGVADIGIGQIIGAIAIFAVWLLNVSSVRPAVWVNRAACVLVVVSLTVVIVGPLLAGKWSTDGLEFHVNSVSEFLVWMFIVGWTTYGTECVASFAPEFADPARDTSRALRAAGWATVGVTTLMPLAISGTVSQDYIAANPATFYTKVFQEIFGGSSGIIVALICIALFASMSGSTADAGRGLFGAAQERLTIRQFGKLNRHNMPGAAMTFDLVANLLILFLVGNALGIVFASNVGYFVCLIFALMAFLLLRKDMPDAPRPIRLGRVWIPIAAILAVFALILLIVGAANPELAGYGGLKEQLIGGGILLLSLVFFWYRRVIQDRGGLQLREPPVSATGPASAEKR